MGIIFRYCASHDALLGHCLDENGDGWSCGFEGLEGLNGPRHQTMLALEDEEETTAKN